MTQVRKNTIIYKKYAYDGLGRLVREDNRDLNKTFVFTYDKSGNITNRFEYAFTLGALPVTPEATFSYGYDTTHKDRLTDYTIEINGENPITESVGSYELGNPWTYRGKSATWKNVHRLASYNGITFEYDYAGIRTKKTVNGITTKYGINGSTIVSEQKGADASSRIT
ncbi:MAG: hypothetical protein ACI4M6_00060 [Christensenellaceae bacterium]